jgi:hypothetical protein
LTFQSLFCGELQSGHSQAWKIFNMSDKNIEWPCNSQNSNLRLSVQEIAASYGTMSAYDAVDGSSTGT